MRKNPLIALMRNISRRRHVSKTPTRIMPLKDVRSVMVFIDGRDADYSATQKKVKAYFESKDIEVHFLIPREWDINWWGKMKHNSKEIVPDCDMFFSLSGEDVFAADIEAIRSKARFKVGCHQLKGNVYDLVFTTPRDILLRQPALFDEIRKFLDILQ